MSKISVAESPSEQQFVIHPIVPAHTFSWTRTSHGSSRAAEHALLSRYLDVSYPAIENNLLELESSQIPVNSISSEQCKPKAQIGWIHIGNDQHINTLICGDRSSGPKKALIILHGYGAGLGFFYRVCIKND